MKQILLLLSIGLFIVGCGGGSSEASGEQKPKPKSMLAKKEPASDKGIGVVKNVKLNETLDPEMIKRGKSIYDIKCAACHKLSDQRVVGPGWKGITTRRTPEWIMNMTINVEEMLEKDPTAKEMLKECLVKMPNQNLTEEDARDVLEFMIENDSK